MEINKSIYKIAITFFGISVVLLYLLACSWFISGSRREVIACYTFSSQADAQAAYKNDPKKYARLDRNHDGKVCQNMK